MALTRDLTLAWSLVGRLAKSRRSRRALERTDAAGRAPLDGTVRVAVYFADTSVNMYQIRQWYGPLARLNERYPVAIVARSPGATVELLAESPVPVVYARQVADLETFVASQPLALTLYVNQNAKNFQMMRYGRMWHVFVNHGESDKMYMTTNQFKAYDYAFVAGDAALDRLSAKLWDYDLEKRAVPIGRPQADHVAGVVPFEADGKTVVLYAPTWEGDRSSAAYGSIASHGVALVSALISTGRHRIVYRPHPRSGVVDRDYRRAHETIVKAIAAANLADPSAQHVYDSGSELGWQLVVADVAITDISAMVYDRLATGKPLVVTRPVSPDADVDERGYLGDAEWLTAAGAGDVAELVDRVQADPEARGRLDHWVTHHFGDTTPGMATQRFEAAVARLVALRDEYAATHPVDVDSVRPAQDDSDGDIDS
ncbi:CDP-glycerol glycerophosphotransferase family protein [Frigoribacterium faeni]|uniref:CDP-glycerol glycerophosphotransferase family protein n=1 Tax=Frigoribacterium faeni TaxID=145483 RepID=UPI001FAB6035|nr:CDP-glycerol glycerophosphotransferase family protein [Frigoribacterium faeni]MCJ0700715.1 CDP-glycerol glycerophosphotransferase family protein [Frigoribacterium faeni]